MEYVYAAMLLHSAEKTIDDDAVSAVLKAAGKIFTIILCTEIRSSLNWSLF